MTVLSAVPLAMTSGSAEANGDAVMQQPGEPAICLLTQDCSPPKLLNLDQAMYAATPAQVTSLRKLENEAVNDVIEDHGLSAGDIAAVQSWGRDEALAKLFMLLLNAISTDSRSTDQQNAVDWLSRIAAGQPQSRAALGAQAAGREYVKWAGLNSGTYETLVNNSSTTKSELTAFLDDNPQPWKPPLHAAGYCAYRSPAPYGSEYTGYNDRTCFAVCSNILGCNPPTPKYEEFVKWGEAVASYQLLTSADYAKTSQRAGLAAAVGVAAAAAGAIPAVATAGSYAARVAQIAARAADYAARGVPVNITLGMSPLAAAAAVATIVIVAVVIAVVQGITVINASQLPGQLAELIIGARTGPPDLKSLAGTSDGATSLLSMFVGATLPAPRDDTCDNSGQPRGVTYGAGWYVVSGAPPCLNPSPIPPASPLDPQFLVRADGSPTTTRSATITWKDAAAGTTTTARLHKNWFIAETNGSVAQTLGFTYTDWDGEQQHAYLLGPDDDGEYSFFSLNTDPDNGYDADSCVDDGLCTESDTLKYLGPGGEKLSATVEPYVAPTGTPKYTSGDEGQALSFDANGFKPGLAEGAITYRWRFQDEGLDQFGMPSYGTPVAGAIVTHTWDQSRQYSVELTATDAVGRSGTTTFPVTVGNVPPTLDLVPDCPHPTPNCLPRAGTPATPLRISGHFDDAGVSSNLTVSIDWGDGGGVQSDCIGGLTFCVSTDPNDPIDLRPTADNQSYILDATHAYTAPGTYYGRVSVADRAGGMDSETLVITIGDRPAAPSELHGEIAPAAGLGSGQVKLAWSAPVSNGATITDYRIERSADRMVWSTVSDAVSAATTSTLDDMGIFATWLRVTAVTTNGAGPPSDPIQITPQYGPLVPMLLTAAVAPEPGVGSGQVKLSWGNPIIGENLTGYFVQWSVDGTNWTTVPVDATARSYTVDGLTNFTSHRFRLLSRNPVGVSPPREIEVTPAGTAAAPAGLAAVAAPAAGVDSGQVRLSWEAAPATAAVTDYVIESSADAGATWTTVNDGVSTATQFTVGGLTNGTQYSFRVAAKNAFGIGPSSSAIPATPVWRPAAPRLELQPAPRDGLEEGQIKLTWDTPANNGAPITDYLIEMGDGLGPASWTPIDDGVSTATTFTVNGLTNNFWYAFRVAAKNAVGVGPWSTVTYGKPTWVPKAPNGLTPATAPAPGVGSGQVKLTWNAPGEIGEFIIDYVVESSVDGTTWTTVDDGQSGATTYTVSGLDNGTQYRFRVAAKSPNGVGPWSPVVEARPAWLPATPGGLTPTTAPAAGVGSGQVKLTWTAPADNGAAITDYVIESSLDGTTWTTVEDGVSTATTYTVSGLTNGTRYSFRVAAKNGVGLGAWSTVVEATPVAVPEAPSGLKAVAPISALGTQARLSWNAAADNGTPITDYVIQSSVDGTTWTTVNDGVSTATTYTVNGLINALRYSFRVAAKNAVGAGPSSPAVRPTLVLT